MWLGTWAWPGAAVFTGVLATLGGWQTAFAAPGVASLIIGATLFLRHRRANFRSSAEAPPQKNVEANGSVRTQVVVFSVICVAALFGGLVFNVITISLPKFFDERLKRRPAISPGSARPRGWFLPSPRSHSCRSASLLDKYGARTILLVLLGAQVVLLIWLAQATGGTALAVALILVTTIFAQIPITSWLLGHYVRSSLRARAASVEYVLSLGMGAAVVPLIAGLHGAGLGFDFQYFGIAMSAAVVLGAALFLPAGRMRAAATAVPASE